MNINGNSYNSVTFSIDMLDFSMLFFYSIKGLCLVLLYPSLICLPVYQSVSILGALFKY